MVCTATFVYGLLQRFVIAENKYSTNNEYNQSEDDIVSMFSVC